MHLIEYYPSWMIVRVYQVHMIWTNKDDHNLGGRKYEILSLHRFSCILLYKVLEFRGHAMAEI